MRYKKLLLAAVLSGLSAQASATFSDLNSMLQAYAPIAPVASPQLNNLIISINGLAPYPTLQRDALLTLVPLADGSLRAAADAPMRQMLSVLGERLLSVNMTETGFAAGDEPTTASKPAEPAADKPAEKTGISKLFSGKPEEQSAAAKPAADKAATEAPAAETPAADVPAADVPAADVPAADVPAADAAPAADEYPDLSKATTINAAWGQLLGDHLTQNERDSLPGYRANVLGGIIGRDLFVAPNTVFGVAGGYQHAKVEQQDLSGSYLDINRYQLSAYGRYNFCDWPIYLLGVATLATDRYENSRYILVPTVSRVGYSIIANSEFSGWESNVYLESAYVFNCGNFRAIPKVTLMYSHLDINSYYESDAFFLDLNVKYQDMDELMLGVGGKFDYRNRFEKAYVISEFHTYFFHDFMNDAQISTAQFFSGGYAFLSQGPAPAPNSVEIGCALSVHSYKNTSIKVQYDYTGRSDYHSHGAFIKVRHEWV